MMKLIFNVYCCSKCEERIYGIENFKAHLCFETLAIEPQYEFDWLIPQLGLLHFEMTATKSFMNLYWEQFMSKAYIELDFTTENALAYAKKGSDHHKLWDIIETCYIAFTDEIIVEVLLYCNLANIEPNVESFWNYLAVLKNPNFVFMQQMAFVYLHALILF